MLRVFSFSRYVFSILRRMRVLKFSIVVSCAAVLMMFAMMRGVTLKADEFVTFIKYASGLVSFSAFAGAMWTGTMFSARQIETWRMHLIKVRPLSALQTVLGQVFGIAFCYVLSFSVSLGCAAGFGWYAFNQLPQTEKAVLEQRFFETREVLAAEALDFSGAAEREALDRVQRQGLPEGYTLEWLKAEIRERLEARSGEVPPAEVAAFSFKGLELSEQLFLELEPSVPGGSSMRAGGAVYFRHEASGHFYPYLIHFKSEELVRLPINPEFIAADGTLSIEFENRDDRQRLVYFSKMKQPRVVVMRRNFIWNLSRGVLISWTVVFFFTALGVGIGLLCSTPVAMFFGFVYLFTALLTDLQLMKGAVAEVVEKVIISPFSNSALTRISEGLFISVSSTMWRCGTAIGACIVLIAAAALFYSRRELAAVFRRS